HADGCLTDEMLCPLVEVDAVAEPADLTRATVEALGALAPFGIENPRPVIALEELSLIEPPRIMKERHIKPNVAGRDGKPFAALGWNMAHRAAQLEPGMALRLAGTLKLNEWMGRVSVEIEMKDFQAI